LFAFVLSSLEVSNPSATISKDKLCWHLAICPDSVAAGFSGLFDANGADSAAEAAAIRAAAKIGAMLSSKDTVTPPSDPLLSTVTTTHSTILPDQGGSTEQHDDTNSQDEVEANPGEANNLQFTVAKNASKKRKNNNLESVDKEMVEVVSINKSTTPTNRRNSKRQQEEKLHKRQQQEQLYKKP
jgi:hypothetical protein